MFKKWKANKAKLDTLVEEKKDLEVKLKQSKGHIHLLQGDVETQDNVLIKLCDDVSLGEEAKNRDDFYLRLLKSERDYVVSQLSKAQKGFEFELSCLNSKLLALGKDLDLAREEFFTSQKCNQEPS